MKQIVRKIADTTLTIELTDEEIKDIINEFAVIGFRIDTPPTKPVVEPENVAVPEPKPPTQYTMPKTIRTGCFRDHKDEVLQMLAEGMSRQKVAHYFGVTDTTVRRWVDRWRAGTKKVELGPKGLTIEDGLKMLKMYVAGMSKSQIAATYGLNNNTVAAWIKKAQEAMIIPAA